MGRKFGFSFSAKRALGISAFKGKVARATGIPTTRAGRERKIGRLAWGLLPLAAVKSQRRAAPEPDYSDDYGEQPAVAPCGFAVFIRRLLGFIVLAVAVIVGLFAFAFWTSSKDDMGRNIAIFFGVLSAILLFIGARWAKAPKRYYTWRNDPATDRQKSFADELGIRYAKGITKGELSDRISQVTGK